MATYSVLLLLSPRWWMVCLGYTCSTKNWSNGGYLGKDSHHFLTDQKPYHLLIVADMVVVICVMIILEIGRNYRAN